MALYKSRKMYQNNADFVQERFPHFVLIESDPIVASKYRAQITHESEPACSSYAKGLRV